MSIATATATDLSGPRWSLNGDTDAHQQVPGIPEPGEQQKDRDAGQPRESILKVASNEHAADSDHPDDGQRAGPESQDQTLHAEGSELTAHPGDKAAHDEHGGDAAKTDQVPADRRGIAA